MKRGSAGYWQQQPTWYPRNNGIEQCHLLNNSDAITFLYRLAFQVVRRRPVDDALAQCEVLPQKAARFVKDAIRKAAGNAIHQKGLRPEHLVVDEIWVTKGQYRKRVWPHARGKAGIRTMRYTHLNVKIRQREEIRSWAKLVKPYQMRSARRNVDAPAVRVVQGQRRRRKKKADDI